MVRKGSRVRISEEAPPPLCFPIAVSGPLPSHSGRGSNTRIDRSALVDTCQPSGLQSPTTDRHTLSRPRTSSSNLGGGSTEAAIRPLLVVVRTTYYVLRPPAGRSVDPGRHLLESIDAILHRRMGAEHPHQASTAPLGWLPLVGVLDEPRGDRRVDGHR